MTRRFKHLKKGDLKQVAITLDMSYDKVRDISIERYTDSVVEATLNKLNEARKLEIDETSTKAVKKIINQTKK
jgi:hypothetical protein